MQSTEEAIAGASGSPPNASRSRQSQSKVNARSNHAQSDGGNLGEIWFNLVDNRTDNDHGNGSEAYGSGLSTGSAESPASSTLPLPSYTIASTAASLLDMSELPVTDLRPTIPGKASAKRPSSRSGSSTGNSTRSPSEPQTPAQKKRRKRTLTEEKRVERNAREQARSNQLSQQFDELRSLLTQGGIVVPKGTKSTLLSLAKEYILVLQQSNEKAEM